MTSQYDFPHDQWKLVAIAPLLVGMAVARAEESGFFGSIRETRTLLSDLQAGTDMAGADRPAASLVAQASAYDHDDDYQAYKSMSSEALASDAERVCRELATILDEVAEPSEAADYKQWIVAIARLVANAAREDGVRVSPGETSVIDAVTQALGINADSTADPSAN